MINKAENATKATKTAKTAARLLAHAAAIAEELDPSRLDTGFEPAYKYNMEVDKIIGEKDLEDITTDDRRRLFMLACEQALALLRK